MSPLARAAIVLCATAIAIPLAVPLHSEQLVRGADPVALESAGLSLLVGDWHEVAAYGSWTQRRCMRDIVFTYALVKERELAVRRQCGTVTGVEVATGVVRPAGAGGRLKIRFGSGLFSWVPAAWSDHLVLAVGDRGEWCVIGDRQRERLSVLSRTMALDESAMARAIAAARAQRFDVGRLARVPQGPASVTR